MIKKGIYFWNRRKRFSEWCAAVLRRSATIMYDGRQIFLRHPRSDNANQKPTGMGVQLNLNTLRTTTIANKINWAVWNRFMEFLRTTTS